MILDRDGSGGLYQMPPLQSCIRSQSCGRQWRMVSSGTDKMLHWDCRYGQDGVKWVGLRARAQYCNEDDGIEGSNVGMESNDMKDTNTQHPTDRRSTWIEKRNICRNEIGIWMMENGETLLRPKFPAAPRHDRHGLLHIMHDSHGIRQHERNPAKTSRKYSTMEIYSTCTPDFTHRLQRCNRWGCLCKSGPRHERAADTHRVQPVGSFIGRRRFGSTRHFYPSFAWA